MSHKYAIDPTYSVWVSASAGTGKTKILIDRILNLLLNKVNPGRILCLTFTKSAANEMLERINSELLKWSILEKEELILKLQIFNANPSEELIKFARGLFILINEGQNNLKIQTIHSFAQKLLKKFPFEAQISTDFIIMDERKNYELLVEAKKKVWEEAEIDQLLKLSIDYLIGNFHEVILEELINKIINLRLKLETIVDNDFLQLEENIRNFLKIDKNWNFEQEFKQFISNIDITNNNLDVISEGSQSDKEFVENFRKWLNYNFNDKLENLKLLTECFFTKTGKVLQKIISSKLSKNYPDIAFKLVKIQENLDQLFDNKKSAEIFYKTKYCLYFSKILLAKYSLLKQEKNYIDYNDLIILTKELLANSEVRDWVLFKIDESIEHVLIDEAQDTSPVQWEIINYIVEEFFSGIGASEVDRTLFVVGDDKQSIYSFQGSDPYLFDYYANYYEQKALQSNNKFCKLDLNISYRSTEPVLKLINQFLNQKIIKDNFLHDFDKIKHNLARTNANGSIELWPLVKNKIDDELSIWPIPESYSDDKKSSSNLAHLIAIKIKYFLDNKIILESQNRPIEPKDIMILVRTRNYLTTQLISKLKEFSLPVAGIDRYNLREHLAVWDLLAIGNFVFLPEDDLNLASLLKSPLFNLNEEDLFELSYKRTKSIWYNLSINKKFEYVHIYLNKLLEFKSLSPYSFYHQIIEIEKIRIKFINSFGEEVNDALNEFLSLALLYEEENIPALYNFLTWFEKGNEQVKREIDNNKNVIRIMTIHASKGLQAPIVFLPDTTSLPLKDYDFYFINQELCLFPGKVSQYNLLCHDLKNELDFNLYKEYLRLLYVAITRAADHLIITGYSNNKSIDDKSWYSIIKSSFLGIENLEVLEFSDNIKDYFDDNHYHLLKTNYLYDYSNCEAQTVNLEEIILNNDPYQGDLMNYLKLSPSNSKNKSPHPLDVNQDQLLRGRLIHNLLEILPQYDLDQHEYIANQLINYYEKSFIINDKKIIVEKILNLLKNDQLKELFLNNHKREVSLSGKLTNNGKSALVRGKIDLLCITEFEIKIIDFKSDIKIPKTVEEVPLEYLKQLFLYYEIIKEIYPNKKVSCLLFWIEQHLLMEINNSLFEKFKDWEFINNV